MFGAVMLEEENCRQLLELILGFPIEKVEVDKEKSMVYNPDYKGIRLDILAKDEAELTAAEKVAKAHYYRRLSTRERRRLKRQRRNQNKK